MLIIAAVIFTFSLALGSLSPLLVTDDMQDIVKLER